MQMNRPIPAALSFRLCLQSAALQQEPLQFLCRDAETVISALNQADVTVGDMLFQINDADVAAVLQKAHGNKADTEIRLDHRQNLIRGCGGNVRRKRNAVCRKKAKLFWPVDSRLGFGKGFAKWLEKSGRM